MESIERAVLHRHPALYISCRQLQYDNACEMAHRYGLVDYNDLISMIYELKFHSKESYMFPEVVELACLKNGRAPIRFIRKRFIELVKYLSLTGFQDENYNLEEFTDILFSTNFRDFSACYDFGYTSTDPTMIDFARSVLKFNDKPYEIKHRLFRESHNIIKALRRGVPYNLMERIILREHNLWILSLYPLVLENEKVGKLFFEISRHHKVPIPPSAASELVNLKDFMVGLANLPDRIDAMEKLLLITHFPKNAQLIYNSPHPLTAFKNIIMGRLSKWRYEVALKIDWESEWIENILLVNCQFRFAKDYYDGYKENSMFDDFILALGESLGGEQLKDIFIAKKISANFFQIYRRKIVKKEVQGTVYSIIKDLYELELDSVSPLSKEVNFDYEYECMKCWYSRGVSPSTLWLWSEYINMVFGGPFPISRFFFHTRYSINSFFDYCRNNQNLAFQAFRKVYDSLASYCRPQRGFQEIQISQGGDTRFDIVFDKIWRHNITHCNVLKTFENIKENLENDQVDYWTKMLLLQIFKSIIEMHFPNEKVLKADFGTWTDFLKDELSRMLDNLRKSLKVSNDDPYDDMDGDLSGDLNGDESDDDSDDKGLNDVSNTLPQRLTWLL